MDKNILFIESLMVAGIHNVNQINTFSWIKHSKTYKDLLKNDTEPLEDFMLITKYTILGSFILDEDEKYYQDKVDSLLLDKYLPKDLRSILKMYLILDGSSTGGFYQFNTIRIYQDIVKMEFNIENLNLVYKTLFEIVNNEEAKISGCDVKYHNPTFKHSTHYPLKHFQDKIREFEEFSNISDDEIIYLDYMNTIDYIYDTVKTIIKSKVFSDIRIGNNTSEEIGRYGIIHTLEDIDLLKLNGIKYNNKAIDFSEYSHLLKIRLLYNFRDYDIVKDTIKSSIYYEATSYNIGMKTIIKFLLDNELEEEIFDYYKYISYILNSADYKPETLYGNVFRDVKSSEIQDTLNKLELQPDIRKNITNFILKSKIGGY